ncbi:lysophospholipid acyltransferase family protein [Parendozoicomonas haliclonae]|uniref:2-acyl-glycerophospho-ethanolamine acyltransferase n=1 Tax=Parendozoicomonas haliclonae TaxID=1960125 RepID=A0A1X7ADR9_9GAMM|nr:lysophospholipid acyltransferase family protein [Parendozoicomonas haliclonae]SMA32516.1 2-acyl-glycerophospho-ethanolamine acyltransferase [Parendozoicomonas haliclonae]
MTALINEVEQDEVSLAAAAEFPLTVLLRRIWRATAIVGIIALGIVLAFWIQLLIWAEPSRTPSKWVNDLRLNLKQWWLGLLCKTMGVKIHKRGGPWTGTTLMVCNHISWLDIPILATSLPFHFLAKSEIRKWPIIGWLAAVTGTLFIRRGSGDSRSITRQLSCYLSLGNSILFFPEGTTSDGNRVLPFHSRLFESAITSDVVIQPITLAYCEAGRPHPRAPFIGDDSLVPHIWQMLGEKQIHIHLVYHPPLKPSTRDARALAKETEEMIRKGLTDIFPLVQLPQNSRQAVGSIRMNGTRGKPSSKPRAEKA